MRWSAVALLTTAAIALASAKGVQRIAIIGEGVIGLSTATALLELADSHSESVPYFEIDVFSHLDWEDTLSRGIAGLFRIDNGTNINRVYGNQTFVRLAQLFREHGGFSGAQLVSGHIISDDVNKLNTQSNSYADIVYNFRFMTDREIRQQFKLDDYNVSAIHYTAYTAEGLKYCPFMKRQLKDSGRVRFHKREIVNVAELGDEGYDVVINCAGLNGAKIADDGDESKTYPIRGVLLKVDAPWQKHFLYRDFATFTIPVIDSVYVGTVKEDNNADMTVSEAELEYIFSKYLDVQPAMRDVKIVNHFVGLRPGRESVRVEKDVRHGANGTYTVVHNYGHAGNGFTLGYGTALHAARLALGMSTTMYDTAMLMDREDYAFSKVVMNPTDPTRSFERLKEVVEQERARCDEIIEAYEKEQREYRELATKFENTQKKISHPIMVPLCGVGYMPGRLVRTNEVMVSIGSGYFIEQSVHQTLGIIDRRIKKTEQLADAARGQRRNADERLRFASGLFAGGSEKKADGAGDGEREVEIREEYDEEREEEARRRRRSRVKSAGSRREEKEVAASDYEKMMSRLDELERQEEASTVDQAEEDTVEAQPEGTAAPPKPPPGVSEEEYKKLLARLDELEHEDDSDEDYEDEEGEEELDSDDVASSEEAPDTVAARRTTVARRPKIPRDSDDSDSTQEEETDYAQGMTMTIADNDTVALVEGNEENKPTTAESMGSKLRHKRSVRFKKNLEAGPCEQSKSFEEPIDLAAPGRSILRNKSEESPIDMSALDEMEDRRKTSIVPAGDAFSGCIVERNVENPIVFKPADEPPRRVSRFKLQRMQLA